MTPETISLIKELSLNLKDIVVDAIKILGAASITAYAAYRVAKIQLDLKIKELKSSMEFGAREHLFKYYTDRQNKLNDSYKELSQSLGSTLGNTSGFVIIAGKEFPEDSKELFKLLNGYANFYKKVIPTEIDIAIRDMEKNGLIDTTEYLRLIEYKKQIGDFVHENTIDSFQECLFSVLGVYYCLQQCNESVLEKRIEEVFEAFYLTKKDKKGTNT